MLGFRFSYLYKLHTESFMGFNAVCLPGNTPGAFFRSSLPATPVSTPIRENGRFSEQALRERLCRTPSPRKCRLFESRISEPEMGFNSLECGLQLSSPDDEIDEDAPSVFSPVRPGIEARFQRMEQEKENTAVNRLKRRVFVGNIGYRVTKKELQSFFSKFGKVVDCLIVQDHIKRQPRGYGFVIFSNPQDAEKARNASSSELELNGQELRVFPAEERGTSKFKREAREILLQQNFENGEVDYSFTNNDQCLYKMSKSHSLQNINEMNDDMLLLVFSYLDVKERVKLERVCKKWQSLALRLWHSQKSLEFPLCFSLSEGRLLTNAILQSVLKKCASFLTQLDLSTAAHNLDYQAVEIIATFCPNLEVANLSSVKVTNVSLQQLALKCPNLKTVVLQNCLEVGERGIWWLLHLCKKLEHVDLTGNPRITGQCFHMSGSNVQTVVLSGCSKFSPAGFTKLATKCRNLKTLKMKECYQLSDRALELLCQSLKGLKVLHLGGTFPHLTSNGLHHIGRLTSLEELSLAFNHGVNDDSLYAISRGCRKLRFLDISGCYTEVSDYSLSSLASCYHLRTLYISYLDKITDEGLSSVARQGQLEELRCRGCPNVGDQGFLTLVMLCPYLKHLDVSGCRHVTNVTISACLDTVQARSPKEQLSIIVGGTNVELEALELDSSHLKVSRHNYCVDFLCPDYTECRSPELSSHSEDEEELEVFRMKGPVPDTRSWELPGAVGGEEMMSAENVRVSSVFEGDWSEVHESPL